jgi:hypothetical protein
MYSNDNDYYMYESLRSKNELLKRELYPIQFQNRNLQLELEKLREELQIIYKISSILVECAPEPVLKYICAYYKNYANQDDLPNVRDFVCDLHKLMCNSARVLK